MYASPGSNGPLRWAQDEDRHDSRCTAEKPGRCEESEAGPHLYRPRHYHSGLGKFVVRDPIGYDAGDPNLYNYVFANPLSFVDPFGQEVEVYQGVDCAECCILIILLQYDTKSEEGIGPGSLAGNQEFKDSASELWKKLKKEGERVIGLTVNSVSTREMGFDLLHKAVKEKLNEPDVKKKCKGIKQIVVLGHGTGTQDKPGLKWPTSYVTNPNRKKHEREEKFGVAGTDIGFDIGSPKALQERIEQEEAAKKLGRKFFQPPVTLYEALFHHPNMKIRQIDLEGCYTANHAEALHKAWSTNGTVRAGGYTSIADFGKGAPPSASPASVKMYYPKEFPKP